MNQNFDAYKAQVTKGEKELKNNGVGMVDAYRVRLLPGFEVLLHVAGFPRDKTMPNQGSRALIIMNTCRDYFSAISKPNFAEKY